ncbi:MAG: virulence protein RhuM/Fic/DOC family protein [Desulfobulbaceae bacterium]|nr:virulence protein RhuM/Fic/DOC family protein [Desulfobulbaceae bacterium]
MSELITYQQPANEVEIYLEGDTLWLSLGQIADLFGVNKPSISKHLKTIFENGELAKETTISKKETVQKEGERFVQRTIDHYNLDAILSVGYRVNSGQATKFRIWATKILREHLTREWSRDQRRISNMVQKLESALEPTNGSASTSKISINNNREATKVISHHTLTFQLLHQYDQDVLITPSAGREGKLPGIVETRESIAILKDYLIRRNEASEFFGRERGDVLTAILENPVQAISARPTDLGLEAKAAHLLYSIIKQQPFWEGNKRIAAFLFANVLHDNKRLSFQKEERILNDMGLTALTLLIAKSEPTEKHNMIRLAINMVTKKRHAF